MKLEIEDGEVALSFLPPPGGIYCRVRKPSVAEERVEGQPAPGVPGWRTGDACVQGTVQYSTVFCRCHQCRAEQSRANLGKGSNVETHGKK